MQLVDAVASHDDGFIAHYAAVGPLLERTFGAIPIVWVGFPDGPAKASHWHVHYFGHWTRLSATHLQHLAAIGAVEFYSWFPVFDDLSRARFARFLLERPAADANEAARDSVRRASRILGSVLQGHGYGAIPVLDGAGGVALFVPLDGGPAYADVRTWAHAIAREVIAGHPDLFSEAPNAVNDQRVHIHVSSNAEGRWSMLPYSVRAHSQRIATPVLWDELESFDPLGATVHDFPARLSAAGDVFGDMLRATDVRTLGVGSGVATKAAHPLTQHKRHHVHRHGVIISTVAQVLADGKARPAADIWKIAHERALPCSDTVGNLSNNMWAYVERQVAHGLKPVFVPTDGHMFRINEPPDDWPDEVVQPPQPSADLDALITRLTQAASDSDNPTNFELAVCDAFAAMGLLCTHVGGLAAPDGYADAPLGTMGYRVMFECKSGTTLQKSPNIFEAAKYKDAYRAKYAALIGSQSGTEQEEARSEIKTHGVSLWGADDIVFALRARFTPAELEAAFAPGVVAQEVLPDILWAREHGQPKRVRVIAEIIRSVAWTTQCAAAQANAPGDAPLLTEDAAMLLVDQELAAHGAHVNCTREEVRLAFEWLTNPLVRAAVWTADGGGIVITSAQ